MLKRLKTMKNEEARLNTGLGFVGWFLSIDAFLLGILLANYGNFGTQSRIPIFYLVCSLVGLIQAARFYRDASGSTEYASNVGINARKMFELGNIISDYIGINLLIGAIPLMVCLLIKDPLIQIFTAFLVPVCFMIYFCTEYTISARRYRISARLPMALLLGVPLIIASLNTDNNLFYVSFIPLVVSFLITAHSIKFLEYKDI
jgi:hypothetical protein